VAGYRVAEKGGRVVVHARVGARERGKVSMFKIRTSPFNVLQLVQPSREKEI